MNPEGAPQSNPEFQQQAPQNNGEQLPAQGQEKIGEQSHEREQSMRQVDRQNVPPPPPITNIPLPPQPVALPVIPQPVDDSVGPTVANDDDLIEKEWVDKAKKIIADTQNDPYRREQEVNRLQIDYLRKRYGKELGTPS
jgi:hypothetical protein